MIIFSEEKLCDVWQEIIPLLVEHCQELNPYSDKYPLGPSLTTYEHLEANNALSITTARQDGALVGYAIYFILPHLHYSGIRNADIDVFFLHPDKRRGRNGIKLLKESEENVRRRGATHITQKCKLRKDLGAIFTRLGYNEIERVYIKEL